MKIYGIKELPAVLDLEVEEVLQLLKQGELEGKTLGDEWMVSERQLREFLDKDSHQEKIPYFW